MTVAKLGFIIFLSIQILAFGLPSFGGTPTQGVVFKDLKSRFESAENPGPGDIQANRDIHCFHATPAVIGVGEFNTENSFKFEYTSVRGIIRDVRNSGVENFVYTDQGFKGTEVIRVNVGSGGFKSQTWMYTFRIQKSGELIVEFAKSIYKGHTPTSLVDKDFGVVSYLSCWYD